ncbi:MAG TPA: adenylate/guanylate cyclase domain-containing protein [Myxococcaceae bacterium]|nr:adenylate/guanylate cyclase domain-containing protein [Myxococcaceae bacterium]
MWQLIINGPRYFDATVFLPEGVTTVGRSSENDIVLTGFAVSRHHAQLEVKGEDLYVVDLGSRNGSQVNGQPLRGTALVRPGDVITVGENTLTVRQPARVENAFAAEVDLRAGGVRRLPVEGSPTPQLMAIRRVTASHLLRSMDDVLPGDEVSSNQNIPAAFRTLFLLQESADKVNSANSLQDFLEEAIDWARQKLHCTAGVVLLRHPGGTLVPVAVRRREGLAQGEVPVADNIVEHAIQRRAALAVAVGRDATRGGKTKGTVGGGDQVLCAPIGSPEQFSGAVYLLRNVQPDDDMEPLLDACNAVAQLVALGVERYRTEDRGRRGERLRKTLERYHAPDILERHVVELARSGDSLTRMEKKRVTALVADISDFSSLVEGGPPERVVDVLNEFYSRMTHLIFSFEGTVDKFMGDSVLALFGAPYSHDDDAIRAVRCAQAMRSEWTRAMNRRLPEERRGLQVGIHTGEALVGTVGSDARLDFTAIGEPINLASWICASADRGQILMSQETSEAVGQRFNKIALGERIVAKDKPKKRKLELFEVFEEDDSRMDTLTLTRVRGADANREKTEN